MLMQKVPWFAIPMTNPLTLIYTCSFELFYQIGLSDFGNFGTIKLDPPLSIKGLIQIAAEQERQADGYDVAMATTEDPNDSTFDWDEAIEVSSRKDRFDHTIAILFNLPRLWLHLPITPSRCITYAYTPVPSKTR